MLSNNFLNFSSFLSHAGPNVTVKMSPQTNRDNNNYNNKRQLNPRRQQNANANAIFEHLTN